MSPASDDLTNDSPLHARGRLSRALRGGAWIVGVIALYLLLQLVVLPRLGIAT